MKVLKTVAALLGALGLVLSLSGCDQISGGDDDKDDAKFRLLNVSPGYQSLDLYVNNGSDDDEIKLQSVGYNTISDYATVDADTYTLKLRRAGVTSTLQTLSGSKLVEESHTVIVSYGSNGHFGSMVFNEDTSEASAGESKVLLLNTGEAGALDVYFTDESVSLDDATPQFSSISHGAATSAAIVDSGTYRLRVTGAGDSADVRFDLSSVTFAEKSVTAVVLTATDGGVLVNAVLLPQQGSPTLHANTKARVRGAVGISSGTAVTARVGGTTLLSNSSAGVISSRYSQVESGTATVSVGVDGTAVAVPSVNLAAGGEYTLLIWNNADGVQAKLLSDDNRLPTASSRSKIRMINSVSGAEALLSLAIDYSPIIEGVALGEASPFVEVDGGLEYQFDVSNTDTGVNLFTRAGATLQSGSVYTMFMYGGGTAAVSGTLRKDR